jgi:hypothetical protein
MPIIRRLIGRRPLGFGGLAIWSGSVDDIALQVNDRRTRACCRLTMSFPAEVAGFPGFPRRHRLFPRERGRSH